MICSNNTLHAPRVHLQLHTCTISGRGIEHVCINTRQHQQNKTKKGITIFAHNFRKRNTTCAHTHKYTHTQTQNRKSPNSPRTTRSALRSLNSKCPNLNAKSASMPNGCSRCVQSVCAKWLQQVCLCVCGRERVCKAAAAGVCRVCARAHACGSV